MTKPMINSYMQKINKKRFWRLASAEGNARSLTWVFLRDMLWCRLPLYGDVATDVNLILL